MTTRNPQHATNVNPNLGRRDSDLEADRRPDRVNPPHEHEDVDRHEDPITGEPGAHPVGSGIGAAAGGAGGAAAGAAAGAMAGGLGGPIGVAAGAIVGGVAGGLIGKGIAEWVNPSEEHEYWADEFHQRDYTQDDADYARYAPAYQYGWESYGVYGPGDGGAAFLAMRSFEDAEEELRQNWEARRREEDLTWEEARPAARDAWNRIHERRPRDK